MANARFSIGIVAEWDRNTRTVGAKKNRRHGLPHRRSACRRRFLRAYLTARPVHATQPTRNGYGKQHGLALES